MIQVYSQIQGLLLDTLAKSEYWRDKLRLSSIPTREQTEKAFIAFSRKKRKS